MIAVGSWTHNDPDNKGLYRISKTLSTQKSRMLFVQSSVAFMRKYIGDSSAFDIGSGLSAHGSGGSIAISVGSGTDIRLVSSVTAGDSSGAAGGDASIVSGSSLTSSGKSLTLASGDGKTIGGTVAIGGGDGSVSSGGSTTFPSGVGAATSFGSVAVLMINAGTAGVTGDLLLSTGTVSVGNSRGSSTSLPTNKFFFGRDTYFFQSAKNTQKADRRRTKRGPFFTTMRITPPHRRNFPIDLQRTGR